MPVLIQMYLRGSTCLDAGVLFPWEAYNILLCVIAQAGNLPKLEIGMEQEFGPTLKNKEFIICLQRGLFALS